MLQKRQTEYRLYDTLRKKDLGIYASGEISKKLGVRASQIPAYAKSRSRLGGRYLVEKVEKMTLAELCEEWDRVTAPYRNRSNGQQSRERRKHHEQ